MFPVFRSRLDPLELVELLGRPAPTPLSFSAQHRFYFLTARPNLRAEQGPATVLGTDREGVDRAGEEKGRKVGWGMGGRSEGGGS